MKHSDIEVLMQDRYTKKEAEAALERGTMVYDDFQDYIDNVLKANGIYEGETIEQARAGQLKDISRVVLDGEEYFIIKVN